MLDIKQTSTSYQLYDTQLISGLFEMRDSGGFPTFPFFRLSFSVSLILTDSVSIRDPIVLVSFPSSLSHIIVFLSLVRYESILFARSVALTPK